MPAPLTNSPGWVHWLEAGPGARALTRSAVVLALLVLSLVVAHTQFRGPLTEETMRQAAAARQWSQGHGYVTPVNDPQMAAWLEQRGQRFDPDVYFPELRQPPLYPAVLAGVLAALPSGAREPWLHELPVAPDGFGGDYVLLVVNVILLWLATLQTWWLGRWLFSASVGLGAALALLLSAAIWAETVALNGTPLMMVLMLGVFTYVARAEEARVANETVLGWWILAGAGCGLLFLTDYSAGVLTPVIALAAAWQSPPKRRLISIVAVFGAALVVTSPWMIHNLQRSGSPVGLAWQDVALRAGDPTAEPESVRRSFNHEAPVIDLRKLANKGLSALQVNVQERLWTGGLFFSALFAAGWLYRFQDDAKRRFRAWFTLGLAVMVLAQGFLNSGEGERHAALYATPLLILFGAAFFRVLVQSNRFLSERPALAWVGILALQALPLLQDVLEPRRVHFKYPPYHPGVFLEVAQGLHRESGPALGWMSDVPAGAAWYSGQRVWAQPATMREFHVVSVRQSIEALVLTPHSLDRPFFSELLKPAPEPSRFGDWGKLYTALIENRVPPAFPLAQQQRLAENFRVLAAPGVLRPQVK